MAVGCRDQIDARVPNNTEMKIQERENDEFCNGDDSIVKAEKSKKRCMSSFWTAMKNPNGKKV